MTPTFDNGVVRLFAGDCREVLRELPAESVQTCVTSPPYWGLRDYSLEPLVWGGDEGCEHEWGDTLPPKPGRGNALGDYSTSSLTNPARQDEMARSQDSGAFCACGAWRGSLGLEPTIDLYVEHMVEVFREVRRVLRADGTLWLSMGDSYASGPGQNGQRGTRPDDPKYGAGNGRLESPNRSHIPGLKPKDLCGIPWRVAFALQADGWWLRSDIVWSKPNPMPESVMDRPTRSHEYLFLLTKAERYYYDAEAIREADSGSDHDRSRKERSHSNQKAWPTEKRNGVRSGPGAHGGRNKRSVWEIATEPYPDAHFATFPQKVVEPCILAGTLAKGSCSECGAAWERIVEKDRSFESGSGRAGNMPVGKNGANLQGGGETLDIRRGPVVHSTTTGWRPTCGHDAEPEPALVLDPFLGSGTTAYVAQRLGRRAIGSDLSAEYLSLAEKRLRGQTLPMAL